MDRVNNITLPTLVCTFECGSSFKCTEACFISDHRWGLIIEIREKGTIFISVCKCQLIKELKHKTFLNRVHLGIFAALEGLKESRSLWHHSIYPKKQLTCYKVWSKITTAVTPVHGPIVLFYSKAILAFNYSIINYSTPTDRPVLKVKQPCHLGLVSLLVYYRM